MTAKVYHSELWGLRESKYDWLKENDIHHTEWSRLTPKSEFYFFIPRDERLLEQYEKYQKITDIFPHNGVGMTTARDKFVIDNDIKILENRIRLFKNSKFIDENLHNFFEIRKKKGWNIRKAWNMLQSINDSELKKFILPVLYRPFDIRWIFYHDSVVWRTVKIIMLHMMQENLGLITVRQVAEGIFNHAIITKSIVESRITLSNKGIAYLYPLYIYRTANKKDLFNNINSVEKQPNITPEFFKIFKELYTKKPTPESIFYYIYAVLYSNIYRKKYAEFLKIDFPRIPFTKDYGLFSKMGDWGQKLVDLHLLKSSELEDPIAKFSAAGDNKVEKLTYDKNTLRVYINKTQYFEGVPQEVWEYQIGGYQVCNKWLKDRKGRKLSLEDIKHYCRIVTSLQKTIETQKEIDELYPEVEKDVIESWD